jgi:hypothetical protein
LEFHQFFVTGLFQRAIGESGSVLAEWALDRDGRGKEASLKIAEMSGCPVEPYEDLLTCVQNVDAEILTQAIKTTRFVSTFLCKTKFFLILLLL